MRHITRPKSFDLLPPLLLMLAVLGLLIGIGGCGGLGNVGGVLRGPSPHEKYAESLRSAALDRTALGRAWFSTGSRALVAPAPAQLPFRETVFLNPHEPRAFSWQFDLQRGQMLEVTVTRAEADGAAQAAAGTAAAAQPALFLDLFTAPRSGEEPQPVERSEDGRRLGWRVEQDSSYLLRLQSELLVGGPYTVVAEAAPSLTFPVAGGENRDIGSRFGDPRDGGRRRHQGVDIFAPRGTPALAAEGGRVVRVGTNQLGGNVVWMQTDGGLRLYYAHLDEATVRHGQRLEAGQAVGKVGNSGNARSTPPHLHFGVYAGSPVDPWNYIRRVETDPPALDVDAALLGQWARVRSTTANFRQSSSTQSPVLRKLPRHSPVALQGGRGTWYRAELADGAAGWIHGSLVEAAQRPIRQLRVEEPRWVRHQPGTAGVSVAEIPAGTSVGVLAAAEGETYIEIAGQQLKGWLSE